MIRFGILGTASIVHRFIKGAKLVKEVEIRAIASRTKAKAEAFCKDYPELDAIVGYDTLLKREDIDAIYIATPNFTHKEWILKAIAQGKHVLCEKPMLLHKEEVKECFAFAKANGVVLMEAMKGNFLPTIEKAKTWIAQDKIGKIHMIEATYCHDETAPFLSGWHSEPAKGGGILYDIGVYPLAFVQTILQSYPKQIQAMCRKNTNETDMMSILTLRYEGDALAIILSSCDTAMENKAVIYGSKGKIEIRNFWKSETAYCFYEHQEEWFQELHHASEFQYQIHAFVQDILANRKEDAIMSEQASYWQAAILEEAWKQMDLQEV